MREQNATGTKKRIGERMAALTRWPRWYRISAIDRQSKHRTANGVYHNDRPTNAGPLIFSYSQFANYLTVIFLSAGVSGIGIGEIIIRLRG